MNKTIKLFGTEFRISYDFSDPWGSFTANTEDSRLLNGISQYLGKKYPAIDKSSLAGAYWVPPEERVSAFLKDTKNGAEALWRQDPPKLLERWQIREKLPGAQNKVFIAEFSYGYDATYDSDTHSVHFRLFSYASKPSEPGHGIPVPAPYARRNSNIYVETRPLHIYDQVMGVASNG